MSKSVHKAEVTAVDKTAAGFASIQARAAAASAKLRSMLGGAMAAAGAYMGFSAIKGGIDELGHLSDIAMKTSTSVDELTQATTALNVLGIQNMSVEQLAKSFDYMAKTTGRAGMAGFYQTIEELGKIPDAATRGQEAMRIFGRSGMEFMPLINAAKDGTSALQNVIATMYGIPQVAANAGDAAADTMTIAGGWIKSMWLQLLGKIAQGFGDTFDGNLRGAMVAMIAHVDHAVKSAWRHVVTFFANFGLAWQALSTDWGKSLSQWFNAWVEGWKACGDFLWDEIKNLGALFRDFGKEVWNMLKGEGFNWSNVVANTDFSDAASRFADRFSAAMSSMDVFDGVNWAETDTSDLDKMLEDKLQKAKDFQKNLDAAAISLDQRKKKDGALDLDEAAKKSPAIRNELMLGGSNQSLRAALLGPQLQSETKKQTDLLKKIADNTKDTADNTEDGETFDTLS